MNVTKTTQVGNHIEVIVLKISLSCRTPYLLLGVVSQFIHESYIILDSPLQ